MKGLQCIYAVINDIVSAHLTDGFEGNNVETVSGSWGLCDQPHI